MSPLSGVDSVSPQEVCLHASTLADGKCPVADGIPNEVYKLTNVRVYSFLSIFYTSKLCHAFVSNLMSDSVITPILTSSLKNPSESYIYSLISASSADSKMLDMIVERFLSTSEYQFGFKPGLSPLIYFQFERSCEQLSLLELYSFHVLYRYKKSIRQSEIY